MNKNVLIVCYRFPPFPGIGGRRWAKFAKYFAKNGIQCHIINAYNFGNKRSLWEKDVEGPNIFIHSIKFRFQYLMGLYSKNIGYRLSAKLLRTFLNFTKYSSHFCTSISRKIIQLKCIEIIKQYNIDTVIVSGDPYTNYYTTGLKKKCDIKVILDYRDLWNDFSLNSQNKYHKLTSKQWAFFEFSEKEALKNCDLVVCVYKPMITLLSVRGEKSKEHFTVIPNGFDKDDFSNISKKTSSDKIISLYFGGNIALGVTYFLQFLKSYSELRNSNKLLWEKFRIELNGESPAYFDEELKKINDSNIIFEKKFLSGQEYREKLNNSDFGILSYPDEYVDCLFITKAYDYLYLEKPILYLGKKGKVSDFIENNGIGFSFHREEKTEVFFEKLLKNRTTLNYTKEVNDKIIQEYDINNLSLKYLDMISAKINQT